MEYNPRFKETMRLGMLAEWYIKAGGQKTLFYTVEDMLGFLHNWEGRALAIKNGSQLGNNSPRSLNMRKARVEILDILQRKGPTYLKDLCDKVTTISEHRVRVVVKELEGGGYVSRHSAPPPPGKSGANYIKVRFEEPAWEILGDVDAYLAGDAIDG